MLFFWTLLCSVEFFILLLLLWLLFKRSQSVDIFYRMRRHHIDDEKKSQKKDDIITRFSKLVHRLAKPLASSGLTKKLDFRLRQAGIPLFGAEFIVLSIMCAICGGTATYVITLNVTIAPLVAIAIPILLWVWSSIRMSKRRNSFTEQLSDCLTTVSNALRAGYSFQQAMDVVSREMEPPISTEFERVSTDIAMGVTLEEALEQMNRRVDSADFDLVVTAVLIQREIGGNLAQILDTISDTINERIRMKREINALTAQGRFSAWVLVILPFVTAAFCYVFNHDQTMMLFTEESGRIALAVALIMELIGFITIQRIVDIEV